MEVVSTDVDLLLRSSVEANPAPEEGSVEDWSGARWTLVVVGGYPQHIPLGQITGADLSPGDLGMAGWLLILSETLR